MESSDHPTMFGRACLCSYGRILTGYIACTECIMFTKRARECDPLPDQLRYIMLACCDSGQSNVLISAVSFYSLMDVPILDVDDIIAFLDGDVTDTDFLSDRIDDNFIYHEDAVITPYQSFIPSSEPAVPTQDESSTTPCTFPVPSTTQKGKPCLSFDGYFYTRKRSLKLSTDWRCTKRECKGSLKTQLVTNFVLKASSHSCKGPFST